MIAWPALVHDNLEWDETPREHSLSVIVPVNPETLPGLAAARKVLNALPCILHPNHYLHITLRHLGSPDEIDEVSLDAIAEVFASTPGWTARVRGLQAFPTAIWADPNGDGRLQDLVNKLLSALGNLPEDPLRARAIGHLTLAYAQEPCTADEVQRILEPYADLELGFIEVREAILADLFLDRPYPHWKVHRRFPFA